MLSIRTVSVVAGVLLIASITVAAAGAGVTTSQSDEVSFEVVVVDTNESAAEGETFEVTAEVSNLNDTRDSQQIHLKNADSEILDSVAGPPVTLGPGESERVTLRWELEKGDAGTHELRVVSNDDSDKLTVSVRESVFFDVAITETNAPITAGERLTVSADVTSTENTTETADVWMELNDSVADRRTLELVPGETEPVEFAWESTRNDAGNHNLAAVTNGDRDATTITVDERSTSSSTGWTIPANVLERDSAQFGGSDSTVVPGSDVERVTFENETVVGRVVVDRLRDMPEEAEPVDDPFGVYRIDVPDVATEYTATIEFTLAAESFDDSGTDSVSVLRWDGEEWTELDTETTGDDEVTVTARTHGFSLFAVTPGNETADESPNDTDESSSETNESASETNEPATDSETSTDTSTPESETENADAETAGESSDEDVPGFGLGVSVLAVLTTALLGARRLRTE